MTRRTTYAQTVHTAADLSTEFGLSYATRLFGEEAIASLPTRKSGKNKGAPKGYVCWLKTTSNGYSPYVNGGVVAGVVVRAWIGTGYYSDQTDAVTGMWMGRQQSLCGSRCLLGNENRERAIKQDAERRARDAADMAELAAEWKAASAA